MQADCQPGVVSVRIDQRVALVAVSGGDSDAVSNFGVELCKSVTSLGAFRGRLRSYTLISGTARLGFTGMSDNVARLLHDLVFCVASDQEVTAAIEVTHRRCHPTPISAAAA